MAETFGPPIGESYGLSTTPSSPRPRDGGFSFGPESLPFDGLPPDDMWLVPKDDCRASIETPIDERGLIDTEALIVICKSLIDRRYKWPTAASKHHFYFTEAMYDAHAEEYPDSIAVQFRDLPINIGRVPRYFENVLHHATIPAPIPDEYVMQLRTQSWRVAHSLFANVRNAVKLERQARRRVVTLANNPGILKHEFKGEDVIGQEYMAEQFERHFKGINQHLEDMDSLPLEYRLVNPNHRPQDIATQIGRIVGKRSMPLVARVLAA